MIKTDVPGYVIDESSGAVLNNDEQAWLKYQAERENIATIQELKQQVAALTLMVQQLERKVNEAITNR